MRFIHWLGGINPKIIIICFFILCSLPVGIFTVLLTPVGQAPDEAAHAGRAAGLLHGAILPVRKFKLDEVTNKQEAVSRVKVDTGIYGASFGATTQINNRNVETESDLDSVENEPSDHHKEYAQIPNTTPYFPTAYVPAAIGFAIGLLTNTSPLHSVILGRFAMLAAFLCSGIAALWITAYGEAVLLAILLLPMTLFLAGTINQDGVLDGVICLACAALTKATSSNRIKWLGLISLMIFLAAKPPYLALLAIYLLPLNGPGLFKRLRDAVITAAPVILWVVLVGIFVLVPIDQPPYHPGPLYLGDRSVLLDHADSAANFRILLAHPMLLISMPIQSNEQWGIQHLREMIGIIGQLQISFGDHYYRVWGPVGAIALAGIPFSGKLSGINWRHAAVNFIVVMAVLILTYWMIMFSDYLDWTNAGDNFIGGVQGRYLIPLLPFLLFALPASRAQTTMRQILFATPVMMIGIYDIGLIPLKLVMSYYLH